MIWPAKSRKCTNSAACSSTAVHQNASHRLRCDGVSIVLNGSMVSLKGVPAFGVYAATKAAVRSFARTWSVDLRERRIRVNVVAPGTVVTPAYRSELGMTDDQVKQFEAQAAAATPLGRAVTPDEIAKAVLFLASDDSSYVTGIELFVDGGAARSRGGLPEDPQRSVGSLFTILCLVSYPLMHRLSCPLDACQTLVLYDRSE